MKQHSRPLTGQRGAAAVELAILLPAFLAFLLFTLFTARVLWCYTVAQKAAQDAARYLSTVSEKEMREPVLAVAAAEVASEIVRMEIAELNPGPIPPEFEVRCGDYRCSGVYNAPLPETVYVAIRMQVLPFPEVFFFDAGSWGVPVVARSVQHYVGK
jgi:hypothetical protein